jgi:hypothetical protein
MMNLRSSMRRRLLTTLIVIACLIAISFVAFSPLALTGLEGLSKNWQKLSSIGQTYGAISALISSFALGGVVISVLYQARAGHTAREQSIRTLQQQLIRMQMEDPALMTAMGAPWDLPIPAESEIIREHLYIHMWATFWAGNYVVGEITAPAIRKLARNELFNSKAGRRYWTSIRDNVLSTNEGKYRRFAQIVDEEYRQVMTSNTPVADPVKITDRQAKSPPPNKKVIQQAVLIGAMAATGGLAGRKFSGWLARHRGS